MSVVGEVTGVWGLLTKTWDWYQERADPVFRSASRLMRAFEAHGIKRQQITRVLPQQALPAKPELTMADFSRLGKLKAKLTPQILDWAAEYLNVQRAWFDDVDVRPHVVVDYYKHPAKYGQWLQNRLKHAPEVHRHLCVWMGKGQPLGPDGDVDRHAQCGDGKSATVVNHVCTQRPETGVVARDDASCGEPEQGHAYEQRDKSQSDPLHAVPLLL